jgi:hypothetical protein
LAVVTPAWQSTHKLQVTMAFLILHLAHMETSLTRAPLARREAP